MGVPRRDPRDGQQRKAKPRVEASLSFFKPNNSLQPFWLKVQLGLMRSRKPFHARKCRSTNVSLHAAWNVAFVGKNHFPPTLRGHCSQPAASSHPVHGNSARWIFTREAPHAGKTKWTGNIVNAVHQPVKHASQKLLNAILTRVSTQGTDKQSTIRRREKVGRQSCRHKAPTSKAQYAEEKWCKGKVVETIHRSV